MSKLTELLKSKNLWIVKAHKFTFADKELKRAIGHLEAGQWAGELVSKTKDKSSDSYLYCFKYPLGSQALVPDNNFFMYGQKYYLLAEPDELRQGEIKVIGPNAPQIAEDVKKGAVKIGKGIFAGLGGLLLAYILVMVLINRASK